MAKKISELNSHSKEVEDLLGGKPSWVIRYGLLMLVLLLSVLSIGSWYLKFPGIIVAPVVVRANPAAASLCTGSITVNRGSLEKVKIGQKVILKFPAFPYMKYGTLSGVVSKIAVQPNGVGFAVEVALQSPLVTTTGIKLDFNQELTGWAEIVTDSQSVLSRLISSLKDLFGTNRN